MWRVLSDPPHRGWGEHDQCAIDIRPSQSVVRGRTRVVRVRTTLVANTIIRLDETGLDHTLWVIARDTLIDTPPAQEPAPPPAAPQAMAPRARSRFFARTGSNRIEVLQFILVGALALLALVIFGLLASRNAGTDNAISLAEQQSIFIADVVLTDRVEVGWPPENLPDGLGPRLRAQSIEQAVLWSDDGQVVTDLAGRADSFATPPPFPVEAQQALNSNGDPVTVQMQGDGVFVNADQKYLQVSHAFGTQSQQFVFETFHSYDTVDDNARSIWLSFAPVIVGSLVVL